MVANDRLFKALNTINLIIAIIMQAFIVVLHVIFPWHALYDDLVVAIAVIGLMAVLCFAHLLYGLKRDSTLDELYKRKPKPVTPLSKTAKGFMSAATAISAASGNVGALSTMKYIEEEQQNTDGSISILNRRSWSLMPAVAVTIITWPLGLFGIGLMRESSAAGSQLYSQLMIAFFILFYFIAPFPAELWQRIYEHRYIIPKGVSFKKNCLIAVIFYLIFYGISSAIIWYLLGSAS